MWPAIGVKTTKSEQTTVRRTNNPSLQENSISQLLLLHCKLNTCRSHNIISLDSNAPSPWAVDQHCIMHHLFASSSE